MGLTVLGIVLLLTGWRNSKLTIFLSPELGIKKACGFPNRHSDMHWLTFMAQRIQISPSQELSFLATIFSFLLDHDVQGLFINLF